MSKLHIRHDAMRHAGTRPVGASIFLVSALLCAVVLSGCGGQYACDNGQPQTSDSSQSSMFCISCDDGYILIDSTCRQQGAFTCANGTATAGAPYSERDTVRCARCDDGYLFDSVDNTCVADADSDGIPLSDDVDDDNDGLIEIHNLNMLHNIRYNLAGTTYDDEEDDGEGNSGDITGAPTEATAHCDTATADGVYLCGYELTRDLDFALASSYADGSINNDWRPTAGDPPTVTEPATAMNEGWPGIGASDNSGVFFTAIFDGNGYTISNLYRRASGHVGLFNATDSLDGSTAIIRAIGVVDSALYGADNIDNIGALAGVNGGTVVASYATGAVFGGVGSDNVGGLIGLNGDDDVVVASYATTDVSGNSGFDAVGGLVGSNAGAVIGNYATGDASGGGDSDAVGSLVGENQLGLIAASYATGAATGDAGNFDDVGSVLGLLTDGSITATYSTGNATDIEGNQGGVIGRSSGGTGSANYGFGDPRDTPLHFPSDIVASQLQITDSNENTYPGTMWDSAENSLGAAWDFGDDTQNPALRYADYDGDDGEAYSCDMFPDTVPGSDPPIAIVCGETLLPGQR